VQGTQLTRNEERKTLLVADDEMIIAESETLLQKSVLRIENIISKYGLTVSVITTETMVHRGRKREAR
jgi:hypothetical protein